jgi:hypothetical protein
MTKRTMHRKATDNAYLHKDFHCALNCGIQYLLEHYGRKAVVDYLYRFAREFYAPLTRGIAEKGLAVLKAHMETVYAVEQAEATISLSDDELVVRVPWCPAVRRIRERGETVSPAFVETTRTVNAAICEGTPFHAELLEYDAETGAGVQRFSRRQP